MRKKPGGNIRFAFELGFVYTFFFRRRLFETDTQYTEVRNFDSW
jgi:hypothetical protein